MAGLNADAQRQLVRDQGLVDDAVDRVVGAAALGRRGFGIDAGFALLQVGLVADELDGAAHRTRAIQRALGAAQHFDTIDVEELRLRTAHAVQIARGHRDVIQVHADSGRAGGRTDAANFDIAQPCPGTAGAGERHIRHGARHIREVVDMRGLQLLAADHRDAQRYLARVFLALLRRDEHRFNLLGRLR